MSAIRNLTVVGTRKEADSLGEVDVPSDKFGERRLNGHLNISTSGRI
jgi:hypothetical protein